ncbi:glycoside hydrolase family 31 protein [Paenibacillus sp. GD4]|uniref:glycoside hydrolase family 31 protein n=1 Tax=Paenibacillus sp. GD4 TaxID=3068890 RepID=UPI002796845D|nr:glycoside hydrolase family 31 protein [Paenibacillus sp. GD4]MDQ1913631.1 glycoside hydrolase family 31 protein [Paenibacillus sp. GD4]
MKIIGYERGERGLILETTKGRIQIETYSPSILHIVYTHEEEFSTKESLAVVPEAYQGAEWSLTESEGTIELTTTRLQLSILKATGAFRYRDRNGRLLAKEPDRGGKSLVATEAVRYVYDDTSSVTTSMSADGVRVQAEAKDAIVRKAYHTKLEFEWAEGEALYGLGSHEEGIMNLRGTSQYLYQQNMKAVVPMLVSTKGYGILMDSYGLMTFHDDAHGSYLWTDTDDELDYYFIYGPEMGEVVSGFRTLTGRAPMLPRWAFGYAQSKERYKSQDELINVVKEYRERQIPIDMIILDWMSWTGNLWGQKSFDPERFPDPAEMMRTLHSMDAKLMVSIWPIMNNDGPNHREMKEHNTLLGNQATYDAFSEKARQLYWKQAYEGLFSHGIDAWWCDCTEPFEADWKGEVKPEPEQRLAINTGRSKKYLDPEYINAYSLMHSKGIYEGQREVTLEKRVVNLTRSAYSGQQRYSAITWSGDTCAKWETLRKQVPAGLNFCAAGVPYWTSDIGAFFVAKKEQWFWDGDYDRGCDDPAYRELYLRWFQYGAFLPMFRSHGTDTPREVWRFGEPGSVIYDTLVTFIKLRYRLLPYIYSLAGMVTLRHDTMMRPLAFDFRADENTYDISDQYMLGPALLVNPVLEPVGEAQRFCRSVYLPRGTKWYDFWSGEQHAGGQWVNADAGLDTMPLFVRAGSIVPVGPDVKHSMELQDAPWQLLVYSGESGSFTIYEDEGDSYRYEQGQYAATTIRWDDEASILTIEDRVGSYAGMNPKKTFLVHKVTEGQGFVKLTADPVGQPIIYEGKTVRIQL